MQQKNRLGNITDTASLQDEIEKVRARIYLQEQELAVRLKQAPSKMVLAGAGKVVPAFIMTKLTGASLSTIVSAVKLAFGGKKAIGSLAGSLARVGIFTALRTGFNKFLSKK
jgi:hypothetical protein